MNTDDTSTVSEETVHTLSVLEDFDQYRNLHQVTATLVFVLSAVIGVLAFFFTLDLTKWFGIEVEEPWMQISIPYFLTFVVWIFAYFLITSVLQKLGFRDLYVLLKNRLSNLKLGRDELSQLHRDINDRELKHKKLFEAVLEDLVRCSKA